MSTPAGWYDDPHGGPRKRWWDGHHWTDHLAPDAGDEAVAGTAEPAITEVDRLREEYEQLRSLVVETREVMLLQEVGLYEYSHPLDSSVHFKDALKEVQAKQKAAVKNGTAVQGTDKWAINGSQKEGAKMVSDFCKLLLRAYNTEADNLVRSMKPFGKDASVERLGKMRASVSKLGSSMKIAVTEEYHQLKVKELELTSDFKVKLAEEKEREKEEKARLREEAAARKEFEREQAKLEKEKSHYVVAIEALKEKGDMEAATKAEEKLNEVEEAIQGVIDRAANVRAGYVYVISNIGSFGNRVVKIGLTRRLDPMDRVKELGDASVPFKFDVHCMVFSKDAVGLETALHQKFSKQKVNHVNLRREFFYVSLMEVRDALEEFQGDLLKFEEAPEALEWHQSQNLMRNSGANLV